MLWDSVPEGNAFGVPPCSWVLSLFSRGGWRVEKWVTPFSSTHWYILAASAAVANNVAVSRMTIKRYIGNSAKGGLDSR
jgi:hypothetical protein